MLIFLSDLTNCFTMFSLIDLLTKKEIKASIIPAFFIIYILRTYLFQTEQLLKNNNPSSFLSQEYQTYFQLYKMW